MQSLREDRISAAWLPCLILLPLFFFYLDRVVILWVKNFRQDSHVVYLIDQSNIVISFISNGATLLVIAVLIYLLGRWLNKRLHVVGKSLIAGLISVSIIVQVLKHLVGRARPGITDNLELIGPTLKAGYESFPSGHTSAAFAFAFILSKYFPKYRASLYIFAVVVAIYRVEVLFHFPSDVMAGAAVGLIVAKLVLKKMAASQEVV